MSTQNIALLHKLNVYGNKGGDHVLVDISNDISRGDTFGAFDALALHCALKVSKHIFQILDEGTKLNMISHAMTCLMAMCESDRNSEATSFLESLENTTVLKHCVHGCRQPDPEHMVRIW